MKNFCTTLFTFLCCLAAFGQQHYPIGNMLGVNLHFWDIDGNFFPAKIPALIQLHPSSIRIYYDADACADGAGNYGLNPTAGGGWTPETSIQKIKQSLPDLFTQITWHRQTPAIAKDWVAAGINTHLNFPYKYNNTADRQKPTSFANMGHDLAILTLRGGSNSIGQYYPIITNPWPPYNTEVKGAAIYNAVEGGNEWNAWWGNFNTNMNSKELAAAWVPMFDSVKATDNTMLFTNGGIASDKPDTFLKAIDWWRSHGYAVPVDYFSYHSYPSAEGQYGWGTFGGLNPEAILYTRAKDMVAAVGSIKPVCVGEWGYDVHADSPQNAPAFSTYTAEQTRGNWAVRAVLKFAQAGLYRAQWYRAYQDYPNSVYDNFGDQFATMALLRQYDDAVTIIKRTLVGDYFKQTGAQWGEYSFYSAIRDDSLQYLQFNAGVKQMAALWAVETYTIVNNRPVFKERKINYTLPRGTIYRLNEDSSGVMKSEPFAGGPVTLTSKPFFFVADLVILPLRDTAGISRPFIPELFDVELYDFMGVLLLKKKAVDVVEFKRGLPRKKYFILKYHNAKKYNTEKIYKQ